MDYKTLTDEQLQTERQNIMDEIARRNDLADIPKQAEEMALRFEALGGSKADLAQIVNDSKKHLHIYAQRYILEAWKGQQPCYKDTAPVGQHTKNLWPSLIT